MDVPAYRSALIVGAGVGLSASLARLFRRNGLAVALAARHAEKLAEFCTATGAAAYPCDAANPAAVAALFEEVEEAQGAPDLVVYNAGDRLRGPLIEIAPQAARHSLAVTAFGGFLVAQQAARRMLPLRRGAIAFTGATSSVKGMAQSAPFAMGKFALRGLAQSLARELAPQGIHVAHFVIDGAIRGPDHPDPRGAPDSTLEPEAIARSYWQVLHQPRSAWCWEVELRPWVEPF
jgi:NAD(P)-dependent dehydrogenase (short-subunit alcohol dehydrogenase family)